MQWISSLVNEFEGKPLQKTGMLTKEQLHRFFARSGEQFNSTEFKQLLRVGHQHGRDMEEMVGAMQQQVFEAMGVQGDFGINCLSRVTQLYNDDAAFMRTFYEFVAQEEQVLDEVEMPEDAFRQKYDQLNKYKADMEAQMNKLQGMSKEEQEAYMASVMKELVAQSTGAADCCSDPHGCSHRGSQGESAPGEVGIGGPSVKPLSGGPPPTAAMSEAEQLAFFASLAGKPPQ